jgi:mannose-6-phosphate isomerase-like protein (cupin superfamily)
MMAMVLAFLLVALFGAEAGPAKAAAAVHITGSEIDTALQRSAEQPDSDQPLRVLNIDNAYNLGISVVHRARTGGRQIGPAAEHSAITEIFHFIAGTGTLVTGGTLESPQQSEPDPLSGPTILGTRIVNGLTRAVGPGDVVVVPPNTPVQFTEVNSSELVYLVVRVDPQKVLATTASR